MKFNIPKITFYGGVGQVTGSNFLLEVSGTRFLIDCGLIQGDDVSYKANEKFFQYDPKSVNSLFLTHAHMDHIGRVPKLVRDGFFGEIYSSKETRTLAKLMFEDALHIMEKEAANGQTPLYDENDVARSFNNWKVVDLHKEIKLNESVTVIPRNSGHILGSVMYEFEFHGDSGKKKILFTGDLGNAPSLLLPDPEFVSDVNFIVIESVYGDRNHESKEARDSKFERVVKETISSKKTLLIPAFSLERTQSILYEINELIKKGKIKPIPVFLDSPLASKITKVYESVVAPYKDEIKKEIKSGDDIFSFPGLMETVRVFDSKNILRKGNPKIIIAGSGMSTGGRILSHEKHHLPDENATLMIVGFQAPGTIGRQIADGVKKIQIDEENIQIKAKIEVIEGFSGHMDSDHLLEFVEKASEGPLEKVFVVMGELKASQFLSQRINDYIKNVAICPEWGKSYLLE